MYKLGTMRRTTIAAACMTLLGLAPTTALATEAELAQKIDALQKELESLRAQVKAVQSAPAPVSGGGGITSAPAGLQLSLYGVGHLSADHINTGSDSSSYLHSNSSRFGIKGSYDIGNSGVTAIFQYESGVDLTGSGTGDGNGGANSGGQLFTRARDSYVGIKGAYGSAIVGRLAAHNQWLYDYNLFGDQVGDLGNIWGQNQPGRFDSAVQYRTPDFNGLSAAITYDPTGNQGGNDFSSTVVKVDYGKAGLRVGGAYARYGMGNALSRQKDLAITASYDFGRFNIGGGWQRETDLAGISGADRNDATIGTAFKVGTNGTLKLQYARAGKIDGLSNSSAKQIALGYDYAWDQQTTLYLAYAKTTNGTASAFQAYNWGHGNQGAPGVLAGDDPSALSFGVVYKFDMGLFGKK